MWVRFPPGAPIYLDKNNNFTMVEQILLKTSPTRLAFTKYYVLGLIVIIAGLMFNFQFKSIAFIQPYRIYFPIIIAVGILIIVLAEISRRSTLYTFTNARIIEKRGLFSALEISIPFDKIANYRTNQNLIDRIVGTGTIIIESVGGSDVPEISIKEVGRIKEIKELLDRFYQK